MVFPSCTSPVIINFGVFQLFSMVEWKGKINGEVGSRATFLDQVEKFQVPNFFVITEAETAKLFGDSTDPKHVLNTQLNPSMKSEIKDAYGEIGMSSEVRTADGRAKNLVGGQRNSQLVSVRISGSEKGTYESRLNVGSSKLLESIKQVATSYYEQNDDHPSIIIQKMVEPEHSGALVTDYLGEYGLLEVVEGLGTSLEDGITKPHLYLLNKDQVLESKVSENQVKITRNPINGEQKKKKVNSTNLPFSESEARDFYQKISSQDLNVKFAYKRGSFYIVDAWKPKRNNNDRFNQETSESQPDLSAIRVSKGKIEGEAGRDIIYTDQTIPPTKYEEALISRKGGLTSTDAQKARRSGKPALFSFEGDLSNGQRIELNSKEINLNKDSPNSSNPFSSMASSGNDEAGIKSSDKSSSSDKIDQVLASEVLPVDPSNGEGVYISPPFGPGYSISDRELREGEAIPESGYLGSYSQIFDFSGDKAVIDARQLQNRGLKDALQYLEAELKVLIADESKTEIIRVAVEEDFDVFAAPEHQLEDLKQQVLSAEKKFIMEKLREL